MAVPAAAQGQNASIAATATVQARPLTLLGAALTSVRGELRVRVDGCGSGALAVDVRTGDGTHRASRSVVHGTSACATREVTLQLPTDAPGALAYIVTLEQSHALMSPAFAQFVVPLSALGPRTTLGY